MWIWNISWRMLEEVNERANEAIAAKVQKWKLKWIRRREN